MGIAFCTKRFSFQKKEADSKYRSKKLNDFCYQEIAVNAVVDAFLEGGTVTIDGTVALFKGRRPQFTFIGRF